MAKVSAVRAKFLDAVTATGEKTVSLQDINGI